jgi:5'-nucleotidase
MKFLVTNDDGIDAPGLEALVGAARDIGDPVIVAPAAPQSGVSHAVTWREGVRIEPRSGGFFAIHGTPADCTRLGLLHLVPEAKWILSGINHGANLGADVYYSGTVAAVREALLHGWPGVAFSHYRKSGIEFDWARAERWITPLLAELLARPIESGVFYNVNLPLLPPGADVDVCFGGKIAVTAVRLL